MYCMHYVWLALVRLALFRFPVRFPYPPLNLLQGFLSLEYEYHAMQSMYCYGLEAQPYSDTKIVRAVPQVQSHF